MFFRRYPPDHPAWKVEDVAGRLRRVLAVAGPHEVRIGHHRTYAGNTDPTKTGLALVSSDSFRRRLLRLAGTRRTSVEE
jgi:hypothetical protein